ncbi:DUF2274 domain-containing protein [Sinorhizobium meliloti]|uniref:DUF2274 domain-containing protein n=1 Tax=Rhizobium meliloti TaxID=382 RepID=UPI00040436C6|nr:DUF2274 domain-containing protein [Sinorhizobium meliloti]ARS71063.1 hypothetical protein SMRU11_29350 [Sinorhizobium meliloti RU11/001]
MTKLKLSGIPNDKPVKITVELPATVFRDLQVYATILAQINGEATPPEPSKLIVPMIQRFMASDRDFGRAKRSFALQQTKSDSVA